MKKPTEVATKIMNNEKSETIGPQEHEENHEEHSKEKRKRVAVRKLLP